MQKYMYFRSHFEHHKTATKLATKLLTFFESHAQSAKYKHVTDALRRLMQCRHILQWTYCLAYFLKQSAAKELFEMQQRMLNNFTEELQELIESHEKTSDDLLQTDNRHKIISKANLIADYAEKTIKSIEDGDLVNIMMYEADASMSGGWTCTACGNTHEIKDEDAGKAKKDAKAKDAKDKEKDKDKDKDAKDKDAKDKEKKEPKKKDPEHCSKCGACRTHGEAECKACKPKDRDHW